MRIFPKDAGIKKWNGCRRDFIPDDVLHLGRSTAKTIRNTRSNQALLRSFFHHAKLKL